MNSITFSNSSTQEEERDPLPCYITVPAAVIYVTYQLTKQGFSSCWQGVKNGFLETCSSFECGFIEGRKFSQLTSQIAVELASLACEGISLSGKEFVEHATSGAKASWIFSTYFFGAIEKGIDPLLYLSCRAANEMKSYMKSGCSESLKGIASLQKETKEVSSLLFPFLLIATKEFTNYSLDGGREIAKTSLHGFKLIYEAASLVIHFPVDCAKELSSYIPPSTDQLRQLCFSLANVLLELANKEIAKNLLMELFSYLELSEQETVKIYIYVGLGLKQSKLLLADLLFTLLQETREQMEIAGKEGEDLVRNSAKITKELAIFLERDVRNVVIESSSYCFSGAKETYKGMLQLPKVAEATAFFPKELLQLLFFETLSYLENGSIQTKEALKKSIDCGKVVGECAREGVMPIVIELADFLHSSVVGTGKEGVRFLKKESLVLSYPYELIELMLVEMLSHMNSGTYEGIKLKETLLKTDVPNVVDSLIIFPFQEWWHEIEPEIQAWLNLHFHGFTELIQKPVNKPE